MPRSDNIVSVMMISYNHEQFIGQAIDSALSQRTEFPFEIVIGDDCSQDRTPEIIQEYVRRHPDRVRCLRRPANVGMLRNFTDVFQACSGRYIAVLEGDDYWTDPNKLQIQAEAMDRHPDWALSCHRVRFIHDHGRSESQVFPEGEQPSSYLLKDLFERSVIQTCSVMYRSGIVNLFP